MIFLLCSDSNGSRTSKALYAVPFATDAGTPRVVLDVPLLLENDAQHGLAQLCDVLVFVDAPAEERERRAQRERGWPRGEVARREAAQLALSEKKKRAHHVLHNDRSPEAASHGRGYCPKASRQG